MLSGLGGLSGQWTVGWTRWTVAVLTADLGHGWSCGQCWSVDSKVLKPNSWVTGGQFIIFKIAVCTCRGQSSSSLFNTHYQFIRDSSFTI